MKKRFFLVDCNNFFVSCERVFNPKLINKPVAVLSSNDGCIIARSNEVKALGIKMGAPAWEHRDLIEKENIQLFSSNFTLYADMSQRVMGTLALYARDIEIYSIDEAFLHIRTKPDYTDKYYENYARFLRHQVRQYTGIPVSVGIGPTKTLAKIANKIAKKHGGAFDITDHPEIDEILATIPVGDIWGVGWRYAKKLISQKILTARDFKYADEKWIRKNMTINGHKTLLELRGIPCMSIQEETEPKQSITVSRSFGKKVTDKTHLKEALASFISTAAEKLRAQNGVTGHVSIFISKARHHEVQQYYTYSSYTISIPTSYTPRLIEVTGACLEEIYEPGFTYKSAGVIISDISTLSNFQLHTAEVEADKSEKSVAIMEVMDRINSQWGRNRCFFGASGIPSKQFWKQKAEKKSQHFTTSWHELLTINI